ncbi:cell division protein FtsL [Corallococcus sp. AB049A]|uniref:Cell division protein FtsL n=1 Tax=Corallococcus interemptor TaxID=2316720 RepID=A0A3A8QCP3_9BACT|nr:MULTISPECIES: cell division protein FtsL [Corallococcus]RKH50035.1 cell division protein FtsL [Corallococcus sp. AB050B]RKH66407.1 cell division protein FtsL [Corallococcus interemptor]RKI74067.1 cell division protein FtsL [Corallococcus sp. AB049A]
MSKALSRPSVSVAGVLLHLLPAVMLFTLFAGVGILHVTSRVLVVDMGYRLSNAEGESRSLTRENDRLKLELATLKAPARLERVAREQLGMAMPKGSAVVSLADERVKGSGTAQARSAAPAVRVAERGTGR